MLWGVVEKKRHDDDSVVRETPPFYWRVVLSLCYTWYPIVSRVVFEDQAVVRPAGGIVPVMSWIRDDPPGEMQMASWEHPSSSAEGVTGDVEDRGLARPRLRWKGSADDVSRPRCKSCVKEIQYADDGLRVRYRWLSPHRYCLRSSWKQQSV